MRRGLIYSAFGWGVPALLALASVPALARALGADRFGLLAVAWAAVAAFGALDLGLGRATTYLVARGGEYSRNQVVAGAGAWMWIICGPLGLLGFFAAPWIAQEFLTLPPELTDEAIGVLRLLSITVPVAAHGIVLRAALEGEARWGMVNLLRAPLGLVTWGGPWLAVLYTQDVRVLVAVICIGRALHWLAQWAALDWAWRKPAMLVIWREGGWMTLSALASPILVLADRAVIAARLPIAGVGWFVGVAESASKLSIVSNLLQPILFQSMVLGAAAQQPMRPHLLRGVWLTLAMMLPVALPLLVFAPLILPWWLADAFAPDAVLAFRLFIVGILGNGLASVAYAALQAGGRARAVAWVHVLQLPVYLPLLVWAAVQWGGIGAAVMWSARNLVDALLLWMLIARPSATQSTAPARA